jgi:hypothetical protein
MVAEAKITDRSPGAGAAGTSAHVHAAGSFASHQ